MRKALMLSLLLPIAALADGPARVDDLGWLAGAWESRSGGAIVSETWVGPRGGLMVAVNLTTAGAERRSFEFLRIADTPGSFSYFAQPSGRPPVEFKLKEAGERRIIFENAAHDFPQRVLYWRDGEALMARIEGMIRGEARQREWRFERVR